MAPFKTLLAAALVCALSTAINWEGRPLPDVLEEIEVLARGLRRSELERSHEDGHLDDQAFEVNLDFVMRRGGGMAAIAAREPAARRLVTIIARARAAGVTIIADDMIEEKLRQSSCPDKFADVVESEMAKRIEAARRRKAWPIDFEAWIGKNLVDRALDTFHRLGGWRPPVSNASKALCAAAKGGDARSVELALRDGADVNFPCALANGTATALWIASVKGHPEIVALLLSKGADTTALSVNGFHALYVAAGSDHGEVVRLLLENSEVNPFDATNNPGGFTPLHAAADMVSIEALEILIEDGRLPIDGLTDKGETPLYRAARNGSHRAVEILLARNADATIANNAGFQPLYAAAEQNQSDSVRLLLNVVDPRNAIKNPGGFSPVHIAAKMDSKAALELLLDRGARCRRISSVRLRMN